MQLTGSIGLKEKYQKSLSELTQNIQMMEQLISKPFEKDTELSHLKTSVQSLEREIAIKIQTNQMKQGDARSHAS